MIDVEAVIEHELDQMLPIPAVTPDWGDVERRFGQRKQQARSRHLRHGGGFAVGAVVLAAAIAVAVIAPWSRSGAGGIAGRALAALGSQPVLHVVAQFPPAGGDELVDLKTGATMPLTQTQEMEVWFDRARGLKHTIVRSDGRLVDDTLETPQGGYAPGGVIYDCAWIAAHPVEATKARVSCNPNGDNGTTPRQIPRPKPSIDPGLQAFLDGYQQALASGTAHKIGAGELDGRPVVWLAFDLPNGGSEQVAVDSETARPLLVRNEPGSYSYRIKQIETESAGAADFTKPTAAELPPQPSFGGVVASDPVPLVAGSLQAALPGAVWPGSSFQGQPLVRAQRDTVRTTFFKHSLPSQEGVGLRLFYRQDPHRPSLWLMESAHPQFGYMWGFVRSSPSESELTGKLYTSPGGAAIGFTVVSGIYVTIQAQDHESLLAAARSLHLVQ